MEGLAVGGIGHPAGQVDEAATFGVDRQPSLDGLLHRLLHAGIGCQGLGKELRVAAGEIETGELRRQLPVGQG